MLSRFPFGNLALGCGFMLRHFSHVQLFVSPQTVACQAPLFMGLSRQEYWSGLPRPPSGDLLDPGIEPRYPTLQADSLPAELPGKPIPNYGGGGLVAKLCLTLVTPQTVAF